MSMIDPDDRDKMRDEAEARKKRLAAAVPPVPQKAKVLADNPEAVIRRLREKLAITTMAQETCISQSEATAVADAFNDSPPRDGRRWSANPTSDVSGGDWSVNVMLVPA